MKLSSLMAFLYSQKTSPQDIYLRDLASCELGLYTIYHLFRSKECVMVGRKPQLVRSIG